MMNLLVCVCFGDVRKFLAEYVAEGLPADQPGRFVEWLYKQEPVYGYALKDYLWDIGTPEAYQECNQHFASDGIGLSQRKAKS